jgi:hypothetical protein
MWIFSEENCLSNFRRAEMHLFTLLVPFVFFIEYSRTFVSVQLRNFLET